MVIAAVAHREAGVRIGGGRGFVALLIVGFHMGTTTNNVELEGTIMSHRGFYKTILGIATAMVQTGGWIKC